MKKKRKTLHFYKRTILIIVLSFTTFLQAQYQLGSDIDGEQIGDQFGTVVSISKDGTRMAVGAPFHNGIHGLNSGQVKIYQYSKNLGWIQFGKTMYGIASGDHFGSSLKMNDNGSVIIVGAPHYDGSSGGNSGAVQIYQYSEKRGWVQKGNRIEGENLGGFFGTSVSVNSSGNRVAVGASNRVSMYEYNIHEGWRKLGNSMEGENFGDQFGWSLDLNHDGSILTVGSPGDGINGENAGSVKTYKYSVVKGWTQKGNTLYGEAPFDNFGFSLDLNSEGNKLAIGAIGNDTNGENSGQVKVYGYQEREWNQLGSGIFGGSSGELFGFSVSINHKTSLIAIGAVRGRLKNSESGSVSLYEFEKEDWNQLGRKIYGERHRDQFGKSISLSSDGKIIAVGAPRNDGLNGTDSGHVRTYQIPRLRSQTHLKASLSNDSILKLEGVGNEPIKIKLYNILGKVLLETKTQQSNELKLPRLATGMYILQLEMVTGRWSKKIIINN